MIIPKKLKVGAFIYDIELCNQVDDSLSSGEMTNRKENKIKIDKTLTVDGQGVTFWHEVLHSINGELGEVVIDSLAQQIYQVLKDNKMLK